MSPEAAKSTVVILGAGGHAGALRELVSELGLRLQGFVAPSASPGIDGVEWLGNDDALESLDPATVALINGVGSVDVPRLRAEVFAAASARGFQFATLIDLAASVRGSADLRAGVQVMPGVVVGARVVVHENVILNSGAIIEHDSVVGAHSHLAPGVTIAGNVTIGECVHVGIGATVVQGVTIGSNSIIGAGAVVLRDVPPDSIAVGVPARARQRAAKETRG